MMEERNSNRKPNNRNNSRNNNRGNRNERPQREERPQRKRRVNVHKDTELIVVNNTFGAYYYEHPRMQTTLDMEKHGDEEYITVADLRVLVNSSRKALEGFKLLITEVLDDQYELEDVLSFLGLDKLYESYFEMNPQKRGQVSAHDIKDFVLKSNVKKFKEIFESADKKFQERIAETAIILFQLGEFGDYQKMQVMRKVVGDDVFLDAEETEVDQDITLI